MKVEMEHSEEERELEQIEKEEARERKARSKTKYSAKEQWEKFKQLPGNEKFWYIWEYYKFHIFAILAAIVIIGMFVDAGIKGTRTTVVEGAMLNINYSSFDLESVEKDYVVQLGLNPKRNIITWNDSLYSSNAAGKEYAYTSLMKITAMIEMGDLDLLLTEDEGLVHYGKEGFYCDLSEVLPEDFYQYLEEHGRLVYTDVATETAKDGQILKSESKPVAIRMNDTWCDEQIEFVNQDVYLCILFNSQRTEALLPYIYYLMGIENLGFSTELTN